MEEKAELIIELNHRFTHKTKNSTLQKMSNLITNSQSLDSKERYHLVQYNPNQVSEKKLIQQLYASPEILHVQPNRTLALRSNEEPNDNLITDQWYLELVGAAEAWNLSTGGVNSRNDTIVIAVIDNGFDLDHEDLISNIWTNAGEIPNDGIDNDGNGLVDDVQGWHFGNGDGDQIPKRNHGTSVMGLMGAKGNNNVGIAGINWKVKLLPISIDNKLSSLLSAFEYVRDMRQRFNESDGKDGAFIVATSYSGGKNFEFAIDNPIWCGMYDKMGEVGILNVGATANLNIDVDEFGDMPSTCTSDFLIITTSTNEIDTKLVSAGFGPRSVDIGAPGVNLLTTHIDDIYHLFSGTSAATPLVTGTVGLLYSIPNSEISTQSTQNPRATALKIKDYILEGATTISDLREVTTTGGRLNLANAIRNMSLDFASERLGLQILTHYPNPTNNELNLELQLDDLQPLRIQGVNMLGQIVYFTEGSPDDYPIKNEVIDVSQWATGHYFFTVSQGRFQKTVKISVLH